MNIKSFYTVNTLVLIVLVFLAAARPWRTLNDKAGLRNVADSVAAAGAYSDTMLVAQPIQVVLPQATMDTLVTAIARQNSSRDALIDQKRRVDREVNKLKKEVKASQGELVSIREIEALLEIQNEQPKEPDRPSKPARIGPK